MISVIVNDEKKKYPDKTRGIDILKDYKLENIIAMKVNNKVRFLLHELSNKDKIEFLDINTQEGNKIYVNGLKFIMIIAIKELFGDKADVCFQHSIDKGIYTKITGIGSIDRLDAENIKVKMREIIEQDHSFNLMGTAKSQVKEYYIKSNQLDKIKNLKRVIGNYITLFECKDYFTYFYGNLPVSTSYIQYFDLTLLNDNTLILNFPILRGNGTIPKYIHREKILKVFTDYEEWIDNLEIHGVGEVNEIVCENDIKEFIMMNEKKQDSDLMKICENIKKSPNNSKLILVAGPSSSGKTTTANKMCLFLKSLGLKPHILSIDDYYLSNVDKPRDENGEIDFESIYALDLPLLNKQLKKLLSGNSVELPTYNFVTGRQEFNGKTLKLEENDILIIEGLHALNEELTKSIDRSKKTKIYLSPFTPLSVDNYNHISTTDLRLIRRMLRDSMSRGRNIELTIKDWQKVRMAEEKFIFPFQSEADIVYNTALIYEIGVLKVYIEPLLFNITTESEYYGEARRLLKFLSIFQPIPGEHVPADSTLREFIGGSCFYE